MVFSRFSGSTRSPLGTLERMIFATSPCLNLYPMKGFLLIFAVFFAVLDAAAGFG
jgi:hypothetical protein